MRLLLIIPALLFGLMFGGGGFFFLSETAWPMWHNWQRMQDWQPAFGQLLSLQGKENETIVQYRYEYDSGVYQGDAVGVSEFNDNIGSYHLDMQTYLRNIQRSGDLLPIWVNPKNPAEAVVDRDMRWGLFALVSGFCSIFILIGLTVIIVSFRGSKKLSRLRHRQPELTTETQTLPADWQSRKGWQSARMHSNAAKGVWFLWGFAIFWNAISTPLLFALPKELEEENVAILIALLFPLAGLFLIYKALKATLEYRHFGRAWLHMDPYPGAIGGHVGGRLQVERLEYQRAMAATELNLRLECVYSYVSGSGKNRSRRESIKWAEQGQPKIDKAIKGVNLVFRFNIPDGLPQADVEQSGDYHFWRLTVTADIPGIDLNRNYNIPVFATGAQSQNSHHDISAQVVAERKRESDTAKLAISSGNFDIEGLSRAMQLHTEGNQIHMKFPMFRNKFISFFAAIFAVGFSFASYSIADMSSGGGFMAIFMVLFGLPFFGVALVASIATVYLLFNNLQVKISLGEISVLRRLLFIPIYRRKLNRSDISHLSIKRSGSTGQGVDKIEHFKISAHDKHHKAITIAEDIDGKDVASHFRDYLAQRIGVGVE